MQKLIGLDERAEWKAALQRVPHAFGHTWESCHAMRLTTAAPTYLYQWESRGSRAVCPIAERTFRGHTDVFTPYGFSGFTGVGSTATVLDDWHAFACTRGYVCGFLGLNPALPGDQPFADREAQALSRVYVLDLSQSETSLRARLPKGRKAQISAYHRGVPGIVSDPEVLRGFLLEHLPGFLRSRAASSTYHFSPETLSYLLGLPNVILVGAGSDRAVEAVSVFGHTPYVGEYLFNVPLPAGRAHAAALVWHGALELKRRGVPLLNLGGGVAPGDGIARFKQRFGGRELPLVALKQVYQPVLFRELCEAAGADPFDRSGYFPPYHRPGARPLTGVHAVLA